MANEFYNRKTSNQLYDKSKDFSATLNTFSDQTPMFEPDTNGILYELAVDEININTFVSRSEIPDWFCGFIDLNQNLSYLSPQQRQINNFLDISQSQEVDIIIGNVEPVRFKSDFCLKYGIPGSYSYSKCIESDDIIRKDISVVEIDFASNLKLVDNIIKTTLTSLEEIVTTSVDASIVEQQQAVVEQLNPPDKSSGNFLDIINPF